MLLISVFFGNISTNWDYVFEICFKIMIYRIKIPIFLLVIAKAQFLL